MHIHLRRVAFRRGEGDFVAFLHQGTNRNRQFVEIVAGAGIDLAIFQRQAATARNEHQDLSFCCHLVLLSEIQSVSRVLSLAGAHSWVPHSSQSHRDEWGMLPPLLRDQLGPRLDPRVAALTVSLIGALSNLDDVAVRIADIATYLPIFRYRLRDELGSPAL